MNRFNWLKIFVTFLWVLVCILIVILLTMRYAHAEGASLWILGGRSADNEGSASKEASNQVFQVQQEMSFKNDRAVLGYLNEGNIAGDKTDGVFAMYKIPFKFTDRVTTSVALGPFLHATTVENDNDLDGYHYKYGVSALMNLGLQYNVTANFAVQANFEHEAFSSNGGPTKDLFLLGLGYSPNGW